MRKPRAIVSTLNLPSHRFHSLTLVIHIPNLAQPDIKMCDNGIKVSDSRPQFELDCPANLP